MYVKDDLAPNGPPVVFPSQNAPLTKWNTPNKLRRGALATLYLVIWSQEGGKTRADVLPRLTSLWRSLFPGSWDSAPDPA